MAPPSTPEMVSIFSLLLAFCLLSPPASGDDAAPVPSDKMGQKAALIDLLFGHEQRYVDRLVAPTTPEGGPVRVVVKLVLTHLSVDEEQGALRTSGIFFTHWRDRRLKWDSDKYYKVPFLHVYSWNVWQPDIEPWNAINMTEHLRGYVYEAVLQANGQVYINRPFKATTACELDYTHWPWDKQNCNIVLGSWTQTGEEVWIQSNTNGSLPTSPCYLNIRASHEMLWRIASCTVTLFVHDYPGWGNTTELVANVRLERVSLVDRKIAIVGNIFAACLALATFWIHPQSPLRFVFGSVNLLLLLLILLDLRMNLPMAGSQMPLVVMLTGLQAILATAQLLTHIAISNLVSRPDAPPPWLVWPLQGWPGKVVFCFDLPLIGRIQDPAERFIVKEMQGTLPDETEEEEEEGEGERKKKGWRKRRPAPSEGWVLLAQAIDRLTFIGYAVAVGFLFSTYMIGAATTDFDDTKRFKGLW